MAAGRSSRVPLQAWLHPRDVQRAQAAAAGAAGHRGGSAGGARAPENWRYSSYQARKKEWLRGVSMNALPKPMEPPTPSCARTTPPSPQPPTGILVDPSAAPPPPGDSPRAPSASPHAAMRSGGGAGPMSGARGARSSTSKSRYTPPNERSTSSRTTSAWWAKRRRGRPKTADGARTCRRCSSGRVDGGPAPATRSPSAVRPTGETDGGLDDEVVNQPKGLASEIGGQTEDEVYQGGHLARPAGGRWPRSCKPRRAGACVAAERDAVDQRGSVRPHAQQLHPDPHPLNRGRGIAREAYLRPIGSWPVPLQPAWRIAQRLARQVEELHGQLQLRRWRLLAGAVHTSPGAQSERAAGSWACVLAESHNCPAV
eukprot:scaffold8323_cov116-Isochrysis_galbana.AAC.3